MKNLPNAEERRDDETHEVLDVTRRSSSGDPAVQTCLRILAVDDEPDFLQSLQLLLQLNGFIVSTANSGAMALTMLNDGVQPDLIVLDQRMAGMTGTETLKRIRANGCRAPAVLLSAAHDVREIAAAHGFHGWVSKPCSSQQMIEAIHRATRGDDWDR